MRERQDPAGFGDGEAVFRLGPLLLRFIKDRSQEFMDVASAEVPERFFAFEDVEVGLGWRSVEDVRATPHPEGLTTLLERLRSRLDELRAEMSEDRYHLTSRRLEETALKRPKRPDPPSERGGNHHS